MSAITEPRATSSSTLADAHAQLVGKLITPTTPASIDRRALMRHAHLIARRFIGVLPNYRACLAHGLRCVWADAKARAEHRQRFAGYVGRALTPRERADSQRATRRCGASFT
jgi:hypothetical protein